MNTTIVTRQSSPFPTKPPTPPFPPSKGGREKTHHVALLPVPPHTRSAPLSCGDVLFTLHPSPQKKQSPVPPPKINKQKTRQRHHISSWSEGAHEKARRLVLKLPTPKAIHTRTLTKKTLKNPEKGIKRKQHHHRKNNKKKQKKQQPPALATHAFSGLMKNNPSLGARRSKA